MAAVATMWVVETLSRNEVLDSTGSVLKRISHVGDSLGALAPPDAWLRPKHQLALEALSRRAGGRMVAFAS